MTLTGEVVRPPLHVCGARARFPPPPLPVAARHRPCPSPSLAAQGLSPSPSLAPSAAAVSAAAAEALQQPQRRAYFLTNEGNFSPRHPSLPPSPPSFLLSFFFLTSALPLSPFLPPSPLFTSLSSSPLFTHSLARSLVIFGFSFVNEQRGNERERCMFGAASA